MSYSLATLWTVAYQAPLSMGFSRQEYWSGVAILFSRDLPDPGSEPMSPALQADSLPSEPPRKKHKAEKHWRPFCVADGYAIHCDVRIPSCLRIRRTWRVLHWHIQIPSLCFRTGREREQISPPGKASRPLLWHLTKNTLSTSSTHCHLGILKFHAPDVFRIIALPSKVVSTLAKVSSSPNSPPLPSPVLTWGLELKGKKDP